MSGKRPRFGNKRTAIGGQFAARLIDMLRSPAWCALTLSARRVLDRIEIELANHGGTDNGRLPVTYDDFHRYGIHRHAIGPAIREAVALGFLEITEAGRAGNAEYRKPNLFRLTYKHTAAGPATEEWQRIKTPEQAEKIKSQCRKAPSYGDGIRHRKRRLHSAETVTTPYGAETTTTLDISGGIAQRASTWRRSKQSPQEGLIKALMHSRSCSHDEAADIVKALPDAEKSGAGENSV